MVFPLPNIPRPKPLKVTIPTNILRQGKSAYLADRGQQLAHLGAEAGEQFGEQYLREEIEEHASEQDKWAGLSDEMRLSRQRSEMGMGEKIMSKLGPLLAPLEPLKYLDIPIELAAEAVIDPLEWATPGGNQFNWLRGSADREHFEGWKAIVAGMKGEKKLFDVMDDVAHAFEKRPFLAQVGLGFAYAMPVSRIGALSKLGKYSKPTMYALDPAQLPFDYIIAPAFKKAWRKFGGGATARTTLSAIPTNPEILRGLYPDDVPKLYIEDVNKYSRHQKTKEPLNPEAFNNPFIVQKKSTIHRQSNALTKLRSFLNKTSESNVLDEREIPGVTNVRGVSDIVRARDKALLDIQQASFARPGQLERMTLDDLEHFIERGEVRLQSSTSEIEREAFKTISDENASYTARISAGQYIAELKRTKANLGKYADDKTLYELLTDTKEDIFKAVHVKLDGNLMPGDDILGIHATGADSTNILTSRLRFYNEHYGNIIGDQIDGTPIAQPLPLADQTLRHIAATRLAAQPGMRPIDIQLALLHVKDSDQYLTYIEDIEAINTVDDFQYYFGDLALGEDTKLYISKLDPASTELAKEGDELLGGYASKLGIKLKPIQVAKGKISPNNEIVVFSDKLEKMLANWGMSVKKSKEVVSAYALARSKMSGTMGRKSLEEAGAFDTREHKNYVDFIGDIRFNLLKESNLEELDPEIMQRIVEAIGIEAIDEDILKEIAAVSTMRTESIQLLHSFQRLQFRQDVIKTNLERQGYIEYVGNQWRWRKRTTAQIKTDKDRIIGRFGEGAFIEEADAIRLWGPVGTDKGAITQWLDASNTSSVDYVNSYHGINKYTRRQANQLHMHEIMIAATKNRQRQILLDIKDRQMSILENPNSTAAGSEIFSADWVTSLQAGLVDDDLVGLEDIVSNVVDGGHGQWLEALAVVSQGDGHLPAQRSSYEIRHTARKPLLEIIRSVEDLTGFNKLDLNVDVDVVEARKIVEQWLGVVDDGIVKSDDLGEAQIRRYIVAALESKGLTVGASAKTIKNILRRAYNDIPQLFGKDVVGETKLRVDEGPWGSLQEGERVPIKGVKTKRPHNIYETVGFEEQIEKRIEDVTRVLASPEGRDIMLAAKIGGETRTVIPLDFRLPDANYQQHLEYLREYAEDKGITIGGRLTSAEQATGIVPDLIHLTSQIVTAAGKHRRRFLGIDAAGAPLKDRTPWQRTAAQVNTFLAGGMASSGITRVAKLYVARKKGFKIADMYGREMTWQAMQVLEGPESVLKMVTDAPTAAQKIAQEQGLLDSGLAKGHQYLSGLNVKEIEFNPAQTAITGKYIDGTKMSPKVRGLVQEALDVVRLNDVNDFMIPAQVGEFTNPTNKANVYKLLTQVDASLEMLGPEEWLELFNVSDLQMGQMSFLRNITAKMDEKAALKGYYIRKELKAAGVTYKEGGYIPRLGRRSAQQLAKNKDNVDAVVNNMEWWLQERKDNSVFYSIGRDGHTYEDLSYRLGQYVESMNKAMIDTQLHKELTDHMNATHLKGFDAAKYNKEKLHSLNKVVQGIKNGDISPTTDNLEDYDKVITADWSYVRGELHDHVVNIVKAENYTQRRQYIDSLPEGELEQLIRQETKKSTDLIEGLKPSKEFFGDELYQGQKRWMKGLRFTEAEWKSIDQHVRVMHGELKPLITKPAKMARGPARILRTLKAGFDMGVLMIHGYTSLVSAPRIDSMGWHWDRQRAWGTAAKQMFKFLWEPEHYETYMSTAESLDLRRSISPYVILGHSEPLAATANSQSFAKWRAQLGRVPGVKDVKAAHRAEAAFVGTLDILRMELWEGMVGTVKRDYKRLVETDGFPAWTDNFVNASKQQRDTLTEFGSVVNKMTGVYDTDLSALTPTQGLIENSFLFFAPMYRRATYGIIADLARGGMRRNEALRSVGGVITAGALMAGASEYILGNEGAADPTSANFGKIIVGDQKVGISGAWNTVFKLGVDINTAIWAQDGEKDDMYELLVDNPIINALGRRGRSQLAPPASILIDIISGSTYMGDPLRDLDGSYDWSAMAIYGGKQFQPFWADPVQTGGKMGIVGGMFEGAGTQSWRVSDFDKVQSTRQYLLENETGISELNRWRAGKKALGEKLIWSEAPRYVTMELETNNTELIGVMDNWKTKWGEISRGDERQWLTYRTRSSDIDLNASKEIAKATTQFEKGLIDGRKLNQQIRNIQVYRGISKRTLLADPDLNFVSERINELRLAGSEKDNAFQGDILYDLYMADVKHNPNNYDEDENFVWDNYLEAEASFKSKNNMSNRPELWAYIQKREKQWFADNPIMLELDASKDTLAAYWNIPKTIFTNIDDKIKASEYTKAPSAHRKAMLIDADPDMARIAKKIERSRTDMRRENPNVDWALVKFHGARPISNETAIRENLWIQAQQNSQFTNTVLTPHHQGYKKTAAGRIIHSSLTGV